MRIHGSPGGAGRADKAGRFVPALVAIILFAAALTIVSCAGVRERREEAEYLASVEVRNYRGKRLSSINDFVETSIKGPQRVDKARYRLRITGLVKQPKTLTYEQVIQGRHQYRKVVTLNCVEGWSVTVLWQGVLLTELLEEAGIDPKANTVIFHAYDGYVSSLPLSYIVRRNIILAHKINGVTLRPAWGFPFQVVAEDKWGYKWVKWVTEIELSAEANYRGYWERRGYSNEADLDKNFIERLR